MFNELTHNSKIQIQLNPKSNIRNCVALLNAFEDKL
jgi:hypothetical protein